MSTLGIIAGSGLMPRLLAEDSARRGRPYFVLTLEGCGAEEWAHTHPHGSVRPAAIGDALKQLKKANVQEVVLAGQVTLDPSALAAAGVNVVVTGRTQVDIDTCVADLAGLVEDPCSEERLSGLPAPGVTSGGNSTAVDAAGKPGHGKFDGVELIKDACEIRDPLGPDRRENRVVEPETVPARVQMCRLDHHESVGCPECREWRVSIEVPAVAVGEHHNGEVRACCRSRHTYFQRDRSIGGEQLDGGNGDDRGAGADDAVQSVDHW